MTNLRERLATAVVDDAATGEFKCRRDIFTDPAIFDLEMKHIFEGNWVFLAHESQIAENDDYYTTHIGRQPIIITRDRTGVLNAVINTCAHRGAMLCRRKHGNKHRGRLRQRVHPADPYRRSRGTRLSARPIRQSDRAWHRPASLLFIQFEAGRGRGKLPDPQHFGWFDERVAGY